MSFVHLHVHTEYSLLDGFSNIQKLITRAKTLDMPALAITDHGTMFGVIEFYEAAMRAGIKPIIGIEAYMAARRMTDREVSLDKKSSHLLLLAENQTGYQNLLKIASAAQLEGFYYYPRIDHEFLADHAEGLICTSGCMAAEIPRAVEKGQMELARKKLDWYYDVFGPDNFFLELQDHEIPELQKINKTLLDLGPRYQAKYVATNDVHYINPEDARLQDVLLAVQTGSLLSDPNRMRMTDNSYYLRTTEEMERIFSSVPQAISNTLLIADRCEVNLGFKSYHLPDFQVPEGFNTETYLRKQCEDGLRERFGDRSDDHAIRERLEYELEMIHNMGFDAYFLIVWDLCVYAKEHGIWYNARGSAAGSIVAYSLYITLVDPIEHELIFERFLNPGRVSMPDIDLDFRDDRRAEMMEYCARKYGDDKVAQIITFGKMKARAAIRDVGRVQDVPLSEVDRVAKMIPNIPGKPVSIEQALAEVPEFKNAYESAPYITELIDTAMGMEGVIRNAGTHAAGVVVTDKPIIEYLPLHRPTGSAQDSPVKTVTQFEMSVIDNQGLLKVDFLGLSTLTIMARACDLIQQRHGVDLNLDNIPLDDSETFDLLGSGETAGVFQVEGSGMRRYLVEMKPKNLDHVIAMVALFRPGPMDFIPDYIDRMHGRQEIQYLHPLLEPILEETYGITVYQEQIMYTAMKVAGYTASEADTLRKTVAKKKEAGLFKQRDRFVGGAVINGISSEIANQIFDQWEAFARYGFPKGHAADYGVIAVQTAFLKAHYPVEYMTALLSVEQHNTDKVALYVADCRRMGIEVKATNINKSGWDFSIEDDDGKASIRFGLGAVKNVGHGPVDTILEGREDKPFTDLNDFIRRVDLRKVGKRALECLIKVGALSPFGPRIALLDAMERIHAISSSYFKAVDAGQMSLFGHGPGIVESIKLPTSGMDVSQREQLNWERDLIGLYVSDHPLGQVMDVISELISHTASELVELEQSQKVRVAGLITRISPHTTKKGDPMAFAKIEDIQGSIELVIFPRIYSKYHEALYWDNIIVVEGRVDNDGSEPKVLVDYISDKLNKVRPFKASDYRKTNGQDYKEPEEGIAPEEDIPDSIQDDNLNQITSSENKTGLNEARSDNPQLTKNEIPPPPETFPDDWELINEGIHSQDSVDEVSRIKKEIQVSKDEFERVESDLESARETEKSESDETILDDTGSVGNSGVTSSSITSNTGMDDSRTIEQVPPPADIPDKVIQPIVPPLRGDSTEDVNMITVILRPREDKARDKLLLRRIFGIMISTPGNDRFAFHIFEQGRGHLLEFPNLTTGLCPDLISQINDLVGTENIRIETIRFQ